MEVKTTRIPDEAFSSIEALEAWMEEQMKLHRAAKQAKARVENQSK